MHQPHPPSNGHAAITTDPTLPRRREAALLWSLLLGNFVVGTGILIPAGMLTPLARGLDVSLADAGLLVVLSGVLVAIGAPLFAALTSHIDRRRILTASMALYVVAHIVSAIAPDYATALTARVMIAITAAIFTPQAAATIGALLPPERRSAAITMVFIGWSLATVGGMPMGGYVAAHAGWRVAYGIVASLALVACIATWLAVPAGVRIVRLSRASWGRVFASKAHLTVLFVTVLNGTGQFTFFTYLDPSLRASLGADAARLTAILACYGVAATVGNVIAAKMINGLGPSRAAHLCLAIMAVGLATWWLGARITPVVFLAALIWGLGAFATNSVQQARLASLAPEVTSASISLNTSAIYLGQALGSAFGGALVALGWLPALPLVAASILTIAVLASCAATRHERAMPEPSS